MEMQVSDVHGQQPLRVMRDVAMKTPAVAPRVIVQSRQFILRRHPPVCIRPAVIFTIGFGGGPVDVVAVVFIGPHQVGAGIQNGPVVIRDKPSVPASFIGRGRGSGTDETPSKIQTIK